MKANPLMLRTVCHLAERRLGSRVSRVTNLSMLIIIMNLFPVNKLQGS